MKFKHFHWRKCIWKCRLRNGGNFVSVSMCLGSHDTGVSRSVTPIFEVIKQTPKIGFVWYIKDRFGHYFTDAMAAVVLCCNLSIIDECKEHDDVIKWKHFPRYLPFVRGIHRSPVNSPHKGQWRGALMFSLICVWINGWVNNREAGDLRRYRVHYDVAVMKSWRITYRLWITYG